MKAAPRLKTTDFPLGESATSAADWAIRVFTPAGQMCRLKDVR